MPPSLIFDESYFFCRVFSEVIIPVHLSRHRPQPRRGTAYLPLSLSWVESSRPPTLSPAHLSVVLISRAAVPQLQPAAFPPRSSSTTLPLLPLPAVICAHHLQAAQTLMQTTRISIQESFITASQACAVLLAARGPPPAAASSH
ncbi:hypothetical protein E2C01_030375 [Portunus trituberculatus]|uniref:Uncharacterized protein n=1 Tax=Portunus trituberculatus TaxID=210409 RepID=A0A5B7EUP5_PORTR|nr:hypothetical protein [Portunus trituberculatus]